MDLCANNRKWCSPAPHSGGCLVSLIPMGASWIPPVCWSQLSKNSCFTGEKKAQLQKQPQDQTVDKPWKAENRDISVQCLVWLHRAVSCAKETGRGFLSATGKGKKWWGWKHRKIEEESSGLENLGNDLNGWVPEVIANSDPEVLPNHNIYII